MYMCQRNFVRDFFLEFADRMSHVSCCNETMTITESYLAGFMYYNDFVFNNNSCLDILYSC